MAEIIIALDKQKAEDNWRIVTELKDQMWYKVGPILYQQNPGVIKLLKDNNKKVMLDLKFHDIPNTVKGACREAAKMGVDMLTIHLSGGGDMIEAAKEGAEEGHNQRIQNINFPFCGKPPLILGISILTSLSDSDLGEIGFVSDTQYMVRGLVSLGLRKKVDGIVCSPLETTILRKCFPSRCFKIINPGVRLKTCAICKHHFNGLCSNSFGTPTTSIKTKPDGSCKNWEARDDQKRITSPEEAIENGADFLVIGRPIYDTPNPVEALTILKKAIQNHG